MNRVCHAWPEAVRSNPSKFVGDLLGSPGFYDLHYLLPLRCQPNWRYVVVALLSCVHPPSTKWLTPSGHAWQSALMQPTNQPLGTTDGAIERANQLILDFVKDGPRNAREIHTAAEGAKISVRTFQRAAIALGVVKTKARFNGGWSWRLPADEGTTTDAPKEQPGSRVMNDVEVQPRVEQGDPVKEREISNLSRATVIAARIRRLEEIRGKKAPIYAQDSRVLRWAEFGIRDPELREAYERAVTALEETRSHAFVSVGFLAPFVMQVISEGDKT